MDPSDLWRGLRAETRAKLRMRDYSSSSLEARLAGEGLDAGQIIAGRDALGEAWIPGVEVIPRQVYVQRYRGIFSELGRSGQGRLGEIGLWPKQWATARMIAETAKGFHIHPPYVPPDQKPEAWFSRLYDPINADFSLRPYDLEQWDVMYFLQGRVELLLVDERAGLRRRRMILFIEGDDRRGVHNAAVVIPPGVAHALRSEGSDDVLMVYGTTTVFSPEFEGRIATDVETQNLPPEWLDYLERDSR